MKGKIKSKLKFTAGTPSHQEFDKQCSIHLPTPDLLTANAETPTFLRHHGRLAQTAFNSLMTQYAVTVQDFWHAFAAQNLDGSSQPPSHRLLQAEAASSGPLAQRFARLRCPNSTISSRGHRRGEQPRMIDQHYRHRFQAATTEFCRRT